MFSYIFPYVYPLKTSQNTTNMPPKHPQVPTQNTQTNTPQTPQTPQKDILKNQYVFRVNKLYTWFLHVLIGCV